MAALSGKRTWSRESTGVAPVGLICSVYATCTLTMMNLYHCFD